MIVAASNADRKQSPGSASLEAWLETDGSVAFAIAYLLIGEESTATAVLQEARGDAGSGLTEAVIRAALRRADPLPPDRFFLRALSQLPKVDDQDGLLRNITDRLPVPVRTAVILQAVGGLPAPQIAGLVRAAVPAVEEDLRRGLERLGQLSPPDGTSIQGRLRAALLVNVPSLVIPPVAPAEAAEGAPFRTGRRRPRLFIVGGLTLVLLCLGVLSLLPPRHPGIDSPVAGAESSPPGPDSQASTYLGDELADAVQITTPPPSPRPSIVPGPALGWPEIIALDPGEVVELAMTESQPWPMETAEQRAVAKKLFQWLTEAEVLAPHIRVVPLTADGKAPQAHSLYLTFHPGWRLRLQPEFACTQSLTDCAVWVGVEGGGSVRVRQPDLVRYLVAEAWYGDLLGHATPAVLPEPWHGETRQTMAGIKAELTKLAAAEGKRLGDLNLLTRLSQHQESDGRWRTTLGPVWQATLEPVGPGSAVYLILDDETGAILVRSA